MAPVPNTGTINVDDGKQREKTSTLVFYVNGRRVVDHDVDPSQTLLTYLRTKLRLCGTKLGCGEGGCGACTVMVSRYCRSSSQTQHLSVNACLAPVASMHGLAVTTVEGIGNAKGKLHAVQQRIANSHGSQCGFCTPGIVMSMYTLLRNNPLPSMEDMETYFQGNLCRCTGYRPILEGFKTLTDSWALNTSSGDGGCGGCSQGGKCCKDQTEADSSSSVQPVLYSVSDFTPYSPSQEPIFPPDLVLSPHLDTQDLYFTSARLQWFRPASLEALLQLKDRFPAAKMVTGNTELGVEVKFKHCEYPVYISPNRVKELNEISVEENWVTFGASVTLTEIEATCIDLVETLPTWRTRVFKQIIEMLRWFAGKQIRNVAAVGGNIMTGSPISDLNPIFMAAGCVLEVRSLKEKKVVNFDGSFYTGYRRNIVKPNEILLSISVPFTKQNQFFVAYKQSRRRDDDIAIVNAAFNVEIDQDNAIKQLQMAFGGMAPTTVMAPKTSNKLLGKLFTQEIVDMACPSLASEMSLTPGAPGAMIRYRQSLVLSFFFKFYLSTKTQLEGDLGSVPATSMSATEVFHKKPITSHQLFEIKAEDTATDIVGKPIKHKAADSQVSGSAVYIDDMPAFVGELYLAFVTSAKAHAKILQVDTAAALAMEGVVDYVDHNDAKDNVFGVAIREDERVFAGDEVHCVGQVIGAIVAVDQETAQRAARLVKVTYADLPAVITIEEAIAAGSFHPWDQNQIANGDVEEALGKAKHVVEGSIRTGAQEHFYLETHATIAVPRGENDEIEIFSSTQNPTVTQMVVARVLAIPANRVVVRVKRMGGGFGGKESRSVPYAAAVAVAAAKVGVAVRVMLDRDEDMVMTGFRHPFKGNYRVGFNSDGVVEAADVELYNNAGWTMDLSFSVMERAMFHSDNSYKVPVLRARGHCCKTNLASNTAFRGFGGPQGMLVTEAWIEHIARTLNLEPDVVRRRNLYKEGETTHFNQKLVNCTLRRCWTECEKLSSLPSLKDDVAAFNAANTWKKRGVAMVPVKFGIAFTAQHLNQNGALVCVYQDGSVLLSHGGTEMGQGLHTKMTQVASATLGVEHSKVHIIETGTDKVPNTPPTAASAGSDLNGMAVLNACTTIANRLHPYRAANPAGCWEDWVKAAFFDRVSLSATGFHATPDIGYDFKTNSGNPFNYFTYGAACSMVEIDCLTGDHQVLRTDIVMDLGESMNPAIDIGQIEGGFMQGYGMFALEQLVHSPSGVLLTRGPGAYKIPSFNDIPSDFNVSLLRGATNPRAVYSSKAVGEPPLFLAASVFFALCSAIRHARRDQGKHGLWAMDAPATAERIRMACEDRFTGEIADLPPDGTYRPWGVQV